MAKKSSIEKNNRRARMVKQYAAKRAELKAMAVDNKLSPEDRFGARLKLAKLPRNSSDTHSQPMLDHGPAARGISQVQALAPCAA
jgi:small subunit ribosomal protein S14